MSLVKLDLSPDRKTLQQFGYISLLFFGLLGCYMLSTGYIYGWFWLGLGVSAGMLGWVAPLWISWLYIGLMVISYPIGFVVSHLILAFVYFVIITPIGMVMWLIGYDPMKRELLPAQASYWQSRQLRRDVRSYFKQY
ncbi:MAG: hypothetical protein KTR25_05325 [Myxococcales bacterium]|nr:hypothetical protein [Myxococcales bacterium]